MAQLAAHYMTDFAFSRLSSQVIFGAGYVNGFGFFKSSDKGTTWTARPFGFEGEACALAVAPGDENMIIIGGFQRTFSGPPGKGGLRPEAHDQNSYDRAVLYKSENGGASWKEIAGQVQGTCIHAIAIDPQNPSRIFAASEAGLFKSEDAGKSWTKVLVADIRSLKILPSSPKTIYAGGPSGLYLSSDFGQTWTESNEGMTAKSVQVLETDRTGATIYAGTLGGSVLKIRN